MKPHLEFFPVDMEKGWQTPAGYKDGFAQNVLASDLDEVNKSGSRSRLLHNLRTRVADALPRESLEQLRAVENDCATVFRESRHGSSRQGHERATRR